MQMQVVICLALVALVGADECPDGGRCEDGHTCCNDPANGYECCPLDQAECCGDHAHCCPAGTLCHAATSSCLNTTGSVPWVERSPADQPGLSKSFRMIKSSAGEEDDNICPDLSRCPAEFSCLKALTKFGCCPLAQGVPCSDGKHCCPEGHQCSADCRSCIKQAELVTTVLCKDGVSECPDGTTCCENPDGKWACCPLPKAVCCEDKTHCCPEGTTCDVEHSKCISLFTKQELPMWAKSPARLRADWENPKDRFPLSEQVTSKTAVEVTTVTAVSPTEVCPTRSNTATQHVPRGAQNETGCMSRMCKTKSSPCCSRRVNALTPHTWNGYTVAAFRACEKRLKAATEYSSVPRPGFRHEGNFAVVFAGVSVACDATEACAGNSTCCMTPEGGWSCCPLPEAVDCEDSVHCCPKGRKCNPATQACDSEGCSVPWLQKVPTIPRLQVGNVSCDATHQCSDGTTCCKTATQEWACCPLPEAVCCDDHEHCCPTGTTCDLASLSCTGASGSTPMMPKTPAFVTAGPFPQSRATITKGEEATKAPEEDEVVQCDSRTSCPQSNTCCFMAESQKWGCCPLPKTLCHTHCSHCRIDRFCTNHISAVKQPAEISDFGNRLPFTSRTCSNTKINALRCLHSPSFEELRNGIADVKLALPPPPPPQAVCCSDGNHCCPTDYTCDVEKTTCTKGEVVIPWYTKLPASASVEDDPASVQCDGQEQCPDDNTCCQLQSGEWGCCPMPDAVCCPDKVHCCPQGYTCNMASNSCQKLLMLQLQAVPLTRVYLPEAEPTSSPSEQGDVVCDDQTSCPDGQTCCRTSATTWGCCPAPNAVCCSDMQHCCPEGHTCTETGGCTGNNVPHWHKWQVFFSNKKRSLIK
uniref:Granulin a n=1 Tax=Gasterosteus aculeatus TaxID=69293 RepID=G3PNX7_GASAC